METINNWILLDLSKQLEKTEYHFNKTYPLSIRKRGQDTIPLSELEFRICTLLSTSNSFDLIKGELLREFNNVAIENAYNQLISMGIVKQISDSQEFHARILTPYDKDLAGVRHFPRSIVWNITNNCNLNCRHCISNYFENNKDLALSTKLIDRLVDEMDKNALERLQISGGEPLCSPYFNYILESTLNTDICIDVFTNATLITEKHHKLFENYIYKKPGALTFHISIDGDQECHNYLRQNDEAYQKTISNIKRIMEYNGTVNVETIIHNKNLHLLEDYIRILVEIHVQYVYMHPTFHLGYNEKIQETELTIEQRMVVFNTMITLKNKFKGKIKINYVDPFFPVTSYYMKHILHLPSTLGDKQKYPINCIAGLEKMFINCEGEVYPCLLYNKMPRDSCGNIAKRSLLEAWKSSGMEYVRKPIYVCDLPCSVCGYSQYCMGKIKSCRRGIEMMSNNYLGSAPTCNEIL